MSDRERWILYPLLFFSLSLGIKTKWDAANGESTFQRIVCRELTVQSPLEEPRFIVGESFTGGGLLELFDSEGKPSATLQSGDGGGALLLIRKKDQKVLAIGHDSELRLSGVMAFDKNNDGRLVPLTPALTSALAWRLLRWETPSADVEKKIPPPDVEKAASPPEESSPEESPPSKE